MEISKMILLNELTGGSAKRFNIEAIQTESVSLTVAGTQEKNVVAPIGKTIRIVEVCKSGVDDLSAVLSVDGNTIYSGTLTDSDGTSGICISTSGSGTSVVGHIIEISDGQVFNVRNTSGNRAIRLKYLTGRYIDV